MKILPKFLQQLVLKIEDLLDSHFSDRLQTLPVKINNRKQSTTITWNVYPTKNLLLDDLFQILKKLIDDNIAKINGEIIQFGLINGKIKDRGVQEFVITTGKTWEVYLYEPESFIYMRLLSESRINNTQDKWISVDIDIVKESAWFQS